MNRSKIIIAFLFIVFTVLLFEIIFVQKNQKEYENIVNMGRDNIKTVISVKYQGQKHAYKVLKDYLDAHNGNMYIKYTSSKSGKTVTTLYVYFTNETFLKNISLISGRYFKVSENESNKFLSTLKTDNENQIGRISDFAGDHIIEIRTLMNKINKPDTNIFDKYLYINADDSQDKEVFYNGLEKTMQKYGYTIQRVEDSFSHDQGNDYNLIIIAGLSILYIVCMLFIYFDILNSYKKIGIEKMLGFNKIAIWRKRIFPLVLIQFVSNIIISTVLFIIKFKEINKSLFIFALNLLGIYGLLGILSVLILSIPFVTIKKISITNMLKNRNPIKSISLVNSVFKVVLAVVILFMIGMLYGEYQLISKKYKYSFENWGKTKGYAVIPYVSIKNGYTHNEYDKENRYKEKELYFYFNKRGALLADFSSYEPQNEVDRRLIKEEYKKNEIQVNPNYLKENAVLDTNGNRILIDENETEYILLVPESYRKYENEIIKYHEVLKNSRNNFLKRKKEHNHDPHEVPSYHEISILPKQDIKIIWTKANQKLFSYKLDINPKEGNMVKDPIIRVITESNGDLFDYNYIFDASEAVKIKFDETKDGSEYIRSVLANYYDPNYFHFPVKILFTMVEDQIHDFKMKVLYNSAIITVLFAIIIMIILQNVLNYFKQYRERIAIQKFHGFKIIDKYKSYFISITIHWMIVFILYVVITRSVFSMLIVSVMLVIEYIISLLALNRVEKVNVLQVAKGG